MSSDDSWDLDRHDRMRILCKYLFGKITDAAEVLDNLGMVSDDVEEFVADLIEDLDLNVDYCGALYPEEQMWGAVCT